ncbi:MAG: hypothetical protein KBD01_04310 [Acidobacteria bacterium]|nr:hypothetical protein [Acidobacteriota bacterium]
MARPPDDPGGGGSARADGERGLLVAVALALLLLSYRLLRAALAGP